MILYAFVVGAIGIMVILFCLYIYNYFRYLNQTAEFQRKRQKRRAAMKEWKVKNQVKCSTKCHDSVRRLKRTRGETSWKYVPHGGWNFASTPTERENIAESFQNSQLNSTQASETKKRIRENS